MRQQEFSWQLHEVDDVTVVTGRGEIDLASAADFRAALLAPLRLGRCRLVVDLSAVDFIDAAGLGVLVDVNGRVGAEEGSMRLVSPGGSVRRVLAITNLDQEFTVADRIEDLLGDKASSDAAAHDSG